MLGDIKAGIAEMTWRYEDADKRTDAWLYQARLKDAQIAKLKEQRNLWIKSQSLTPENRIKEANAELANIERGTETGETNE